MIAQLFPVNGGSPITIDKDVTIVGRQPEHCDLVLGRQSISKIHCVLAKTDGLLFVRDLASTNGTKVNGQRIIRGALLPGDQLAFAGEKFKVHLGPNPVPVTPTSADCTEMPGSASPASAEQFGDASSSRISDVVPLEDEDLVE